uniref:MBOAT family protein n=1 Tax=Haemonchus placei TaxID=6290 RepID=A0A0N4WSD6_HAEPC
LFIWLASLPLLHIIMHHSMMLSDNPFLIYTFVSYSMLSYVSYCMDTIEKPVRKEDNTVAKRYLRMMFYTFYQPYLFSLIVLYSDFERQIAERKQKPRDLLGSLWFALRITFWWGVLELAVHFMYHETILRNIGYSEALSKDTYFALGLTLGIFFHLKYVIIFGLPSVFARFDNMDPQPGPICISRVMLFSKVWREFDRGLYQFFKTYIFVPICAPTFSLPRKVFGVFVSYSFVLLWHGFYHHNIVWIILNIISLLLEMSSKALYGVESFRHWREKVISDVNFRRVLALLQIVPFAFGLYSNIYFLGGSEVGALFVKRIFDEETIPLR